MSTIKSTWTTVSGSISSIVPLFFSVCKSGACGAVCISPIASILGISSAGLMASPLVKSLFPLLLIISSVSFTISYYKLYVLPTYISNCDTSCACDSRTSFQKKIPIWIFWIGLVSSIVFFTYFEFQNYKSNSVSSTETKIGLNSTKSSNIIFSDSTSADSTEKEQPCCSGDTKCEE